MASPTKQQVAERDASINNLRELFELDVDPKTGELTKSDEHNRRYRTVYTVLRSVAKSGMSRTLTLFVIRNGEPHYITFDAARAVGWRTDKRGVHPHGCAGDGCGFSRRLCALPSAVSGRATRGIRPHAQVDLT